MPITELVKLLPFLFTLFYRVISLIIGHYPAIHTTAIYFSVMELYDSEELDHTDSIVRS